MIIIYILIPINVIIFVITIYFFFLGIKKRQFDNLDIISDKVVLEDEKNIKDVGKSEKR